jgi:hypothetical protein
MIQPKGKQQSVSVSDRTWTMAPGATIEDLRLGASGNLVVEVQSGILTTTINGQKQTRRLGEFFIVPARRPALGAALAGGAGRIQAQRSETTRTWYADHSIGARVMVAVERCGSEKPVPASYGRASYYAEHAFKFTAADGTSRFARYRWMPEAGEAYLSPDDPSTRSPNFLREELEGRLSNGPVAFRLLLQLAGESDPTDDVTALWPADRPLVELGRLEVTRISPTSAADERRLVFDPTNVTDGIGLSADPIPLARSAAYSISYDQRSK